MDLDGDNDDINSLLGSDIGTLNWMATCMRQRAKLLAVVVVLVVARSSALLAVLLID